MNSNFLFHSKYISRSTILNKQNQLNTYERSYSKTVGLATREGFTAHSFHNKFDGIENTLTVIKSKSGSIFGVLTEKSWDSSVN